MFVPSLGMAQTAGGFNAMNEHLSPLEVVHNMDDLLLPTRLEAMQSGQINNYLAYLNVAKSFVHAERYQEAQKAYIETVGVVWKDQDQSKLIAQLERELKKADARMNNDQRPEGLDENYQPIRSTERQGQQLASSYSPQTAGNKIDEMMQFLIDAVYRDKGAQLTLMGDLKYCRHLVEMEEYEVARTEYHETILAHLDPKWTGSLLEDINEVIARTKPFTTPSEQHPEMQLSQAQALAEIRSLLIPVMDYYEGNLPLEGGVRRFMERLQQGKLEGSFELLERTLQPFASSDWIEGRSERMRMILSRTQTPEPSVAAVTELAVAPTEPRDIRYNKEEMEGRTVEYLQLKEAHEHMTYKKVKHRWGGVYYFINDEPTKDTEWLRVWRSYQNQESALESTLGSPTVKDY
jgi:hypothetical protein